MARADEQFNHRIPKELKEEFDAEAKENGRSATQHLVHVLKRRNDVTSLSVRNKGSKPTGLLEDNRTIVKKPKVERVANKAILNDPLSKHLPKRVARTLSNYSNEVDTVKQLIQLTPQQSRKLIGIGDVSAKIINSFLLRNGFSIMNFK